MFYRCISTILKLMLFFSVFSYLLLLLLTTAWKRNYILLRYTAACFDYFMFAIIFTVFHMSNKNELHFKNMYKTQFHKIEITTFNFNLPLIYIYKRQSLCFMCRLQENISYKLVTYILYECFISLI